MGNPCSGGIVVSYKSIASVFLGVLLIVGSHSVSEAADIDADGFDSAIDCNDWASSCTTDCSDTDGDGYSDCLELCDDQDFDGYGIDRSNMVIGAGTVAVGGCTVDGTTPCSFSKPPCAGLDCNDSRSDMNPGETEVCDDSVDNDCDLSTDCVDSDCAAAPACNPTTTSTTTTTTLLVQVFDHLKCYKIKDGMKLKGIVDLAAAGAPFGVEVGCKIRKAKKFCVPVMKTVRQIDVDLTDAGVGQSLTDYRICYKIKCPGVDITENVKDQFGVRVLSKFKAAEVCTPATIIP